MTAITAATALAEVQGCEAWALIRVKDQPTIAVVGGPRTVVDSLLDVPLEEGVPAEGREFDRLLVIPFRQVRERGFDAIDDGTPLVSIGIEKEFHLPVDDVRAALPNVPVEFADRGGFETTDEEYADIVDRIIRDEIGNGEGANLVIGRNYRAQLAAWGADQALTVFDRLLGNERGAYWTFVCFTGDRYLVGASPERHVSVHGGDVRMNPISGTFRLRGIEPADRKGRLLDFLADEKEIFELFMVVDEELKMMCDICNEGGQVLGPYLKPMTHLVHTEYLLAGRTTLDVREVIRDTMYAATVTGAPVENACRLITQYETVGRGYYGAAMALIGRDRNGEPTADSPILIRTADVSPEGALRVTAGTTLVRDSNAAAEVAETVAKAAGVLGAFGLGEPGAAPAEGVAALIDDEDVRLALASRNQRLSRFWLTDQSGAAPSDRLKGRRAVILEGEDDFVNMIQHVLGVLGMESSVVQHEEWTPDSFAGADLVIVGPGPGDPREGDQPKIATYRSAVEQLLAGQQPFLAVCLGHQVLCERLGIPLAYKDIVFQGTQSDVELFGRRERVGFYNTFVARPDSATVLPAGVDLATDAETADVHEIRGPHFRGIQFHAESILTENGFALLRDVLTELVD